MFLKRPVMHFCLLPDSSTCNSAESLWEAALPCALHGTSHTVINVDEWAGRPSLFQPSRNRKFPLSLTMYSLYQSDRVEASYTPLPSPCPYPPPSVYSKEEGKPEEAAKIKAAQADKIYKIRTLWPHPSKPWRFDYLRAFCKNIDCKRNHSRDDGGGGGCGGKVLSVLRNGRRKRRNKGAKPNSLSFLLVIKSWPLENRVGLFFMLLRHKCKFHSWRCHSDSVYWMELTHLSFTRISLQHFFFTMLADLPSVFRETHNTQKLQTAGR